MIDLHGLPLEEEEEQEEDDEEYDEDDSDEEASEDEGDESEEESETTASGEEDEWGFGEKKSRFSKEIVVGFLAITILCSVFGIVVFKNLNGGDEDTVAEEESLEGELGEEGGGEGEDPFASGEVRVASHTEPGGGPAESGTESGPTPFRESETGREMGTLGEPETSGEFGEQTEPLIEEGINTAQRLDPFGQPIGSASETPGFESETPGIGTTSTGIGEGTLGSTTIGETGTETLGSETLGSETLGATGTETLGATGTETLAPLGSETGTALGESTTGLFETEPTTTGETETISPFGPSEPTARVDEFGRPVDEFGRPLEKPDTVTTSETGSLFPDTGSTGPDTTTSGIGGGTLGETTSGIGETTTPLIDDTEPGIGETTTSLFPDEPIGSETGTGSTGDRATGLFPDEGTTGLGPETEPMITDTGTTGTPGFEPESTGTTEGSLFPNTGSPGETLGGETSGGLGTLETTTTGSELPTVRAQNDGPFGSSTTSTTITGGYPVQSGDSYWKISQKVYGTARYYRVLAEYNSKAIPDPAKMRPGMIVQTPDESILRRMLLANSSASAGSPAATRPVGSPPVTPSQGVFFDEKNQPRYRVGKSDTLTTIAADHLGRWARWRQIYEMNRDQLDNPNKLQIGMILKLPADATRTAMTRRESGIR